MSLYLQVRRLIQTTGQFVDDASVRYFQGIHRHVPMVCRHHFHDQLIDIRACPPAGFSMLLLAISLLTYDPKLLPQTTPPVVPRESLYLSIRTLFSQVQAAARGPPSVHFIQAGILLALYEYANGRPDDAFLSIAACARMGYASHLHRVRQPVSEALEEELVNTWLAIIIFER